MKWDTYILASVLYGRQHIKPEQMNAEIALFLRSNHTQYLPASSPAVQACIGEGLGEDDGDDLLPQEELAALCILDNVGDSAGSCRPSTGVNAAEILYDGKDSLLSEGSKLRVGWGLDWLYGSRYWVCSMSMSSVSP